MDWAILWRAGFAGACAGWLLTALLARRARRRLSEQLEAARARPAAPDDDTLPMLRVDWSGDESGVSSADTVVSDATELLARVRDSS